MPGLKRKASSRVERGKKSIAEKKNGGARFDDEQLGNEEEDNNLFLNDDKEEKAPDIESDEMEARETVEEKRLRLARDFLNQMEAEIEDDMRGVTGGSEDDEDEEGEDGGVEMRDKLGRRLKQDADEASGRLQKKLAHRLILPSYPEEPHSCGAPSSSSALNASSAACKKGHRLPATAVALSSSDSFAVTVSKDGSIVRWDLATMTKTRLMRPGEELLEKGKARKGKHKMNEEEAGGADWVKRNPRQSSKRGLYAVAISSDDRFIAVGGGDKKIHLFDGTSGSFLQSFPGHRDAITGLVFRENTHQLYSSSYDRTVKLWSMDDRSYIDTLFGHQAEILSLDILRTERALSGGNDRTLRVWKIPEESQLVFRAPALSTDCVKLLSQSEFISGGNDSTLQVWNQLRKKPMSVVSHAHGVGAREIHGGPSAGCTTLPPSPQGGSIGPMATMEDALGWVQSLSVCHNSDLVASGASDGTIRLWRVEKNKMQGAQDLVSFGGLPLRGCVNGLAWSRKGTVLVAAVGQEPRLGRWLRDGKAKNGIAVFRLALKS